MPSIPYCVHHAVQVVHRKGRAREQRVYVPGHVPTILTRERAVNGRTKRFFSRLPIAPRRPTRLPGFLAALRVRSTKKGEFFVLRAVETFRSALLYM